MCSNKIVIVSIFFISVVSGREKLFDPCNKNDIKCLCEATKNFLEKSCSGLPDYGIKPSDPLIIPELNVDVDPTMGLAFEFKNITVTGLKTQQVTDLQMDTDKKSVVLKTKAVLNIAGDLKITFTKLNKAFTGAYTASATALGSSKYGYSLIKKGDEEYFEVGPEINTCEIIGEPVVSISEVLQNALNNGLDARVNLNYGTKKDLWREKTLCQIIEIAYTTVIHNIRATAKIFPKSAFFKDV